MRLPMMLGEIDWTGVLLYGVPSYIAALGAAIAAIISAKNRQSLRTTNGRTIAEHVEATHTAVTEGTATLNEIAENTNGNN